MSTNRRFLTAWGLIDGHGRLIPGQVILRKKKPTRGRWIELDTYECCDGIAITDSGVGSLPYSGIDVTLGCSDGGLQAVSIFVPGSATTLAEAVDILNTQLGYLGVWSTDGTNITLLAKQSVVDGLACTGDLTLTVDGD